MTLRRWCLLAVFVCGAAAPSSVTIDPAAVYPEGPLFQNGVLHVAEMGADRVVAFEGGRKRTVWSEAGCGPTSLAAYDGGLLVLCHRAAELVALGADFAVKRRWKTADGDARLQDPNDSSADDAGGVYISDPGVFHRNAPAQGAVVYLSRTGEVRRLAENLRYPNGVFFDREERAVYVDEHLARRILRYPVLGPGRLGPPTVWAEIDKVAGRAGAYGEAGPDGLERGPDGDLYVCLYGEGRIIRLARDGSLVRTYAVPTPYVTNIAFGADGAAYVTGSYNNIAPNLDGAVFRLTP